MSIRQLSTSPRFRLGIVTTAVVAAAALTFLFQPWGRAQSPTYTPSAHAYFDGEQLTVAVTLARADSAALAGELTVQLLDGDETVATQARNIRQQERKATHRVTLKVDRNKAAGLTLRYGLGDRRTAVPLGDVLLAKAHETSFVSGQEFYTGSKAPFRCDVHAVRSPRQTLPLEGSKVTIELKDAQGKSHAVYGGTTAADGLLAADFRVPELPAGPYTMTVTTKSSLGEETLQQTVQVLADTKILLVTDKPIYQPGHTMHIRALALRPFDLRPVRKADLVFEVQDSKGNKVFKKTYQTSEYGVAHVDFELADEVNMGDYQVSAAIGSHRSDKTVAVKKYVLPKFKVSVDADKKFYLPKETIKAELQSDYFFGKSVAGAAVKVTASTFDVEFRKFHTWEGKTDESGRVKFEVKLPDYFVGQPLQQGNGLVKLDVEVTDTADHTEKLAKTYTVSEQPIEVSLIPEGGKLVPGMENKVFAATVYPDGSPARATVKLWVGKEAKGEPVATVQTNDAGLAEFRLTPDAKQFRQGDWKQQTVEMLGGQVLTQVQEILLDVHAGARDAQGEAASKTIALNSHPTGGNVLLRLDKAVYETGDSVAVDVRTSAGLPTAYLDVVRGGQIVLSTWLDVKDGQAGRKLDLPQDLFGSLEVHAYQMLLSGEIIRDSRVVYVQPGNDLKVEVTADNKEYEPGENGRIRFHVTDRDGKGTAAALGVIVVDEAVYALQDLQPGLEKVYFTLQEELLKPQAQVLEHQPEPLNVLIRQPALPAPKQQVARALLAGAQVQPPARWQVDPALARRNQYDGQVAYLAWALYGYVWGKGDDALRYDEKAGAWRLADDVLAKMTQAGYVHPGMLNDSFGGQLSLDTLRETEKGFATAQLTAAITRDRMERLAEAFVKYTDENKAKLFKGGRWHFDAMTLADAARQQNLDAFFYQDAWGQGFKLVERQNRAGNKTGHGQFDNYELVSAGPDRDYRTADDVAWTETSRSGEVGGWWHDHERAGDPRLAYLQDQLGRGVHWGGRLRELEELRRFDRDANGMRFGQGGFGGGGGFQGGFGGGFPGGMPRGLGGPVADGAPLPMAAPMAAEGGAGFPGRAGDFAARGDEAKSAPAQQQGQAGGSAPVTRVREYFPETMLWQPALITDENGVADMAVNFADSITTWRLSASASSKAGALGSTTVPLKVFQDFFVDIDLPVALTQNDEVAFPVAVYNYLKTPQTVRLELQKEGWFALLDGQEFTRTLDLKPNEVTSVSFRVRANNVGNHTVTVKAFGSKKSDAVRRAVEVVPDGEKVETVVNDRLKGKVVQTVEIPAEAVDGASKIVVRLYPGVIAQVVEGLEGMMRMPGGCFEQTSSSAYPNILIVDYIKKNRLATPDLLMKAESYLNTGYQRLLTFERPGGGFDWWGSGEPLIWLSAYGLQEFSDMAKVWPVDPGIIARTQQFLLNKMDKDGTWSDIGATHGETIANMGDPKLLLTSYVTWSLLESGLPKDRVAKSIDYIRGHTGDASDNAYILALAANALASYDARDDSTLETLKRLDKLQEEKREWDAVYFPAKTQSLTYARGGYVDVETTALSVLAMVKTGQFTGSVNRSLNYLVKSKDASGTWGSTSATILSLKAMLAAMAGPRIEGDIDFTVKVNGAAAARGRVNADNADVMQVFDLKEFTREGANTVEIAVAGETPLMYQIVGRHYRPWQQQTVEKEPEFTFDVSYDRAKLSTHDTLTAKAKVTYNGKLPANMVMVDLGIAPGFNVDGGEFAELVGAKKVQKFSITPRQVILYLDAMRPGETRTFEYTLRARFPLRAQTPPSTVYEYYTPGNRATARPATLTVVDE